MRQFLIVCAGEILRKQAAALACAVGGAEIAVDEILRHHAAFMAAVTGATVAKAMALGHTLVASFLDHIVTWIETVIVSCMALGCA